MIGSDRAKIEGAIDTTKKADGVMSVPVSMTLSGKQINVSVAASNKGPAAKHGEVWICSVSKSVPIKIGKGENRGKEITYYNVVRNLLKVGDWNGNAGSWTVPLENISRDGVDAAVVFVQDGNRENPGPMLGAAYHVAALNSRVVPRHCEAQPARDEAIQCFAFAELHASQLWIASRMRLQCARARRVEDAHPQKEKGPTLVGPVMGINSPANRPDPDDPGGLGAEESGTERTGPTQCLFFAVRVGGRLSEIGPYYDSNNDPVTDDFRRANLGNLRHDPLAAARSRRNHVGRGVILKRGSRFSEKIMPEMTGGVAWI